MPFPLSPISSDQNLLLSALPREEYARLLPHLSQVHLGKGRILFEPGETVKYAYFVTQGMLSLLSLAGGGETVEVAMVAHEGMVGVPIILHNETIPYRVMVQIPVNALRIKAGPLWEEFRSGGRLQVLLLRYVNSLMTQLTQSAVCNRFHRVEARLCRWLLVARDRLQSDEFHFTQEFISHMLGIPRTHVTMKANALQRKKLINYSRGKITILNPQGLERVSCECYGIVREDLRGFLAA
jgi:CRP-like cAMP-binding protein